MRPFRHRAIPLIIVTTLFAASVGPMPPSIASATPQNPMLTQGNAPSEIIIEGIGFDSDLDARLGAPSPVGLDTPTPMAVILRDLPGELPAFIQQSNRALDPMQTRYIAWALFRFAQLYGVDYRIIASLVSIESSFRADAVSSAGAIGLGQLKPDTARWLGVRDPYHPADNAAGLTRYMSYLLRKYEGNLDKALAAYFQGPGTIDRKGITPECLPYLMKFNAAFARFPSAAPPADALGNRP